MKVKLPQFVSRLVDLASKGEGRFAMEGVMLRDKGGAVYRLEATNGRYLALIQGHGIEEEDGVKEILIQASDWKEAFRPNKDGNVPLALRNLVMVSSDDGAKITLQNGGRIQETRAMEGRFPPTDQVLPKCEPSFTILVDPELLAKVLTVAASVLGQDTRRVQLAFYKNGSSGLLGLTGQRAESGETFDAVIVPLVRPDKPSNGQPHAEEPPADTVDEPEDDDDHVAESQERFAASILEFENIVTVAADSVDLLRAVDVGRVLDIARDRDQLDDFADWLHAKRPDLSKTIDQLINE